MARNKIIILIDMDAFFASCEIAIDPTLVGQPVIVRSPNKHSIVLTANYIAKNQGVKTAMPLFLAMKKSPSAILINAKHNVYGMFSKKIFEYLQLNFTKKIEASSIDEFYLDITDDYKKFGTPIQMCEEIRQGIIENIGITCSIGIGQNRFLAKMSSNLNKPNGQFLLTKEMIPTILWPLDIIKMNGIGKRTEEKLHEIGIFKIRDLAFIKKEILQKKLGKVSGDALKAKALGVSSDNVNLNSELKSIAHETSLDFFTNNKNEIRQIIEHLSQRVSERATLNNFIGHTITVHFRYLSHDKSEKWLHLSKQETLLAPTNNFKEISVISYNNFLEIWNGGTITLIGVRLSKLKYFSNLIQNQLY